MIMAMTCKQKQLHLNHVVPEGPKEIVNLYIELKKQKLNQIAARNIGVYVEKHIAFSK